jgi:hypothetical protein
MNDFLEKEEIISGSSTLTLVNALGMVMGPMLGFSFSWLILELMVTLYI